jgi:opacity protein-like surface antigen
MVGFLRAIRVLDLRIVPLQPLFFMKKTLLLTVMLAVMGSAAFAQAELSASYSYFAPQQRMSPFIQGAYGVSMQGLYQLPNSRIALGANIGLNSYGSQSTRQTYRFSDGSSTETDVEVNNNFFNLNLVGRADLLGSGPVIPYLMGQAGYNLYYTNLYIADPNDVDGCKPLENNSLMKDGAFSLTGGAGVRWDLGTVLKNAGMNRFYVDFSANYTGGGRVRYMNVNIPADPDPVAHQHTTPGSDAVPFTTQFINPNNRVVHEHHVGDVYASPIQMLSFKLGMVFRVGP